MRGIVGIVEGDNLTRDMKSFTLFTDTNLLKPSICLAVSDCTTLHHADALASYSFHII